MAHKEFLVLGSNGYLGCHIVKYLKEQGSSFTTSSVRIGNLQELKTELENCKPRFCICAAGISGRPNIDWCERHVAETIAVNVTGQLNVVEACRQCNVTACLLGTGCFYSGEIEFSEEDEPNYTPSIYTKLRKILEDLLRHYDNVLNLRIIYPLSSDLHPRSTLAKLLSYPRIYNAQTSWTVIDDLFPLIPLMLQRGVLGTFNFVNSGTIDQRTLFNMLAGVRQVDEYEGELVDEPAARGHPHLNTGKLEAIFPDLPDIETSIRNMKSRLII